MSGRAIEITPTARNAATGINKTTATRICTGDLRRSKVENRSTTPQLVDDLALAGEAAFFLLGEDRLAVDADDEDAAAAADELTVDAELLLQRGRQTGGPGKVVSNAAVVDANVHRVLTRMAVTLSRPPRSLAVSIRTRQAFSRSFALSLTARRISSSGTMPVRPSEQRR